jgi:hypothetical protein
MNLPQKLRSKSELALWRQFVAFPVANPESDWTRLGITQDTKTLAVSTGCSFSSEVRGASTGGPEVRDPGATPLNTARYHARY